MRDERRMMRDEPGRPGGGGPYPHRPLERLRQRRRPLSSLLVVLPMLTGCVHRALTIQTDPPGARVYVNDALKGTSPVTYDFEWYGWHRVMLQKDGYERLDDRRLLRTPLHLWIPLDLIMELLPSIRDLRTWSYTLTPLAAPPAPRPPEAAPETAPPAAPVGATTEPGHPAIGGVGEEVPGAAGGRPSEEGP